MRLKRDYWLLLAGSVALALPTVIWPGLDIAVAAYFFQPDPPIAPATWFWVEWINAYVPDTFRAVAVLCLLAWLAVSLWPAMRHRALPLAFVGLSLLLGPGFATWAVKEHHLRARPADVVEFGGTRQFTPALVPANQCTDNCAFVSGHVACGFFFASLMLLQPRRRWRWVAVGTVAGLTVGIARMSVGVHWLSDVLWAFPLTLITSGLVWWVLGALYRVAEPPGRQAY